MLSDSGRRSEVSLFVCLSSVSAAESWDSFQSDSNLAGLDSLSAGNFLSTKSIQTDCYGLPVWDQFSDSSAWHMYRNTLLQQHPDTSRDPSFTSDSDFIHKN